MRLLLLLAAAAPLVAQCTYSAATASTSGNTVNIPSTSFTDTITVTAHEVCGWSYGKSVSWITLKKTANNQIEWTASENLSPSTRTGTITIATPTGTNVAVFTITQSSTSCSLDVTPTTTPVSYGVGGGTATLTVTTNCNWAASRNQAWITHTPSIGAPSDTSLKYTVAANGCAGSRSGTLTVSESSTVLRTFQINQDGSTENLKLTPTNLLLGSDEKAGTFTVATGTGCGWSAVSDSPAWLRVTAVVSGSGAGSVAYSVLPNTGLGVRTGQIQVIPSPRGPAAVFTVTQQPPATVAPRLSAVVNSASGAGGFVSPGEIVSLWGTDMGPASAIVYEGGIPKELGGVQVLFDGAAAPLIFVSATQINAIAPYALAGKTTTSVQVRYAGGTSANLAVPVREANPGIFTLDRSGSGSGAVLNQDYSINAVARPAARGSVVMIYCTGGGITDPASTDAALTTSTPPFPALKQEVSVTIGGVPSPRIWYSGGAPAAVAGLTQINAEIPAGAPTGPNVPVVVQIGPWRSPDGVTIAVQ